MWNLGSGFAQGVYENHRGLDEKREYEELSKQRELARQRTQQIMDKDKIEIENMKYALEKVKLDNLKMAAGNEKLKLSEHFAAITDAVAKNRGKFRTDTPEEIDSNNLPENFDKTKYTYDPKTNKYKGVKTEYTTPADVEQVVKQFKHDVVIDPDGSRWINGIMGNAPDNPVIDVTYNPAKEEMVFLTKDGQERHMQLDMVAYGLGFDKQMTLAQVNRMNDDMARSKKLYELNKIASEVNENNAKANKYNEEAKFTGMDANSRAVNARANEFAALSNAQIKNRELDMIEQGKYAKGGSIQAQQKFKETEQLNNLREKANNSNDKDFYKIYKTSPKLMEQDLMKNGDMRKNLSEATTAALIVKEMNKFEARAEVLMKLQHATTIDDKIKGEVAKYFPGLTDDDWNDRAKLMSYLETQAKQLAANQIKLLSGAAFTTEEFKNQVNDYLAGLNNLKSVDSWKESLASLKNAWKTNAGKYNGMLTGAQQRFLSGLIQSSEEETKTLINTIEESGRVGYLTDSLEEMKNKSPEEQKAWYNGLNPKMKATLKNMRKKDAE